MTPAERVAALEKAAVAEVEARRAWERECDLHLNHRKGGRAGAVRVAARRYEAARKASDAAIAAIDGEQP